MLLNACYYFFKTYEYGIPDDHPYIDDIADVIIKTIQDSGVNQKDVSLSDNYFKFILIPKLITIGIFDIAA